MFYHLGPMVAPRPAVTAALASLQARWGAAAPHRLGEAARPMGGAGLGEVVGSLATVPLPDAPFGDPGRGGPLSVRALASAVAPGSVPAPAPGPDGGRIVPTGFAALDAILGPGGLPRHAGVAVRGDGTSGKTTVALRLAAEAQSTGSIVAWLDLARSLDPVEAVARGVDLDWLVVLTPGSMDDGLAMAGALVQGRAIDLLLVDLPDARPGTARRAARSGAGGRRPPSVAERLDRLAALARRSGTMLVVLAPGKPTAKKKEKAEPAPVAVEAKK